MTAGGFAVGGPVGGAFAQGALIGGAVNAGMTYGGSKIGKQIGKSYKKK